MQRQSGFKKLYRWLDSKIFFYNVTFGLYMLDWWERLLFNILVVLLMWFLCYNGYRYATSTFSRLATMQSDFSRAWHNLQSINGGTGAPW